MLSINFIETELRDVAHAILFDVVGLKYTIDPAVNGKVTFGPALNLSSEELPAMLAGWLRKNCATIVRDGETYKIIPLWHLFPWDHPKQLESSMVELRKQSRQRTRSEDQHRINEIGAIGFETVAAARATITALSGATVSDQGPFEIVDEPDGVTHWRLSPTEVFKVIVTTAPDCTIEATPIAAPAQSSQAGAPFAS